MSSPVCPSESLYVRDAEPDGRQQRSARSMISTRAVLAALASALALPMTFVQPASASAADNSGAAAGDAVVTVGRQDSGPPVRVVHSANSTGAANRVQLVDSGMNGTVVAVVFPRIGGPGGTVTLSTVGDLEPP